jgi:TRAP transporter 4TM/12TM fusion protein
MAQSAVARAATDAVLHEDTDPATKNVVCLRTGVAAAITIISIVWCLDIPRAVGIVVYTEQYLALMLGFCIALVFLQSPARIGSRRTRLPWYDACAALLGVGAAWYTAFNYPVMVGTMIEKPTETLAVGLILFSVAMEAMRRTSGWTMFVTVALVVGYALVGHQGPGLLQTREIPFDKLFIYLALDSSALIGPTLEIGVTVVLAFIFFGNLLIRSHGSHFFNEFAIAALGRFRGGSAKCAIVASGLFGTITGTAASNIMAVGTITIPLMRKAGYPAHVAAAIEAVASTGGALMPPVMGAVAFLMADILQMPYREIAIAAAVPAVLYYLALFIFADLEAAKGGYARVAPELIPKLRHAFETGWVFLLPFGALIWAMFGANVAAERAALYSAATVLIVGFTLGYKGKQLTLRDVWGALVDTSAGAVSVILIVAASGFIMGVLNLSGLGFALTMALVELGSDNVMYLLLMCAVINVFLGLGMPAIGVYVLLAVVVAPSLVQVGIPPLAAHMFIFYFGLMSSITPPVAVSAFFAAQIAGSPLQKTGWTAMRFGWTAYIVPFLFVFSPSLFLIGPVGTVLYDIATAIGGVWLVTAAFVGYLFRPLAQGRRLALALAGALLMIPVGLAPWTIWCNLAGGTLAILVVAAEGLAARRL